MIHRNTTETMANILIWNKNISYVYGDIIKVDKRDRKDLIKLDKGKKVTLVLA